MKIAVFWVVAPCSLVEVYQRSEVLAASIIRAIMALMMEKYSMKSEGKKSLGRSKSRREDDIRKA
jgi:hypothetical protein